MPSRRSLLIVGALVTTTAALTLAPSQAFADPPSSTPTITAPSDADTITTTLMTVTATSSAGSVKFVVDGRAQYTEEITVVSGGATGSIDVTGLDGPVTLAAYDCSGTTPDDCNVLGGASVSVDIQLGAPTIRSPTDGVVFSNDLQVSALSTLGPAVEFLVDDAPQSVDNSASLSATLSLSGLAEGAHSLTARQCNAAGTVCAGGTSAAVQIVKDSVGPRWVNLSASPTTFYPYHDRYRDSTDLLARVSEPVTKATVTIRNRAGKTVRILAVGSKPPGRLAASWDGRNKQGSQVAPGRYSFQFTGQDVNANRSASRKTVIFVSDKRLVSKRATKVVSAEASAVKNLSGRCSSVYYLGRRTPDPFFKNGLGYYSRTTCSGTAAEAIAAASHATRIVPALRYGTLRVDVLGGAAKRKGGPALIGYVNSRKQLRATKRLSESNSWHTGRTVGMSGYVLGPVVEWVLATGNGSWYNVGSFRVTYTYSVLQAP